MRVIALIAVCLLLTTAVSAETIVRNTGKTFCHRHEYIDYYEPDTDTHAYVPERRNPMGVGLDVIVWESKNKNFSLSAEGRHDFQNDEWSAFAVGKVNLFQIIKGE